MTDINIFETLVQYHADRNLREGLDNEVMSNGKMHFPKKGGKTVPVTVGKENGQHWYKGLMLLANGTDITEYLKNENIIPNNPLPFREINSIDEFVAFLDSVTKKDLAGVYDRASEKGTKVRINPNASALKKIDVEEMLPDDFLSENRSIPLIDEEGYTNIGTRTNAAMLTSRLDEKEGHHPVDAYLIKSTMYNSLGFGPVVHASRDSMEMFFFKYDPNNKGPFIDAENSIVGVYKTYELTGERFAKTSERIVYINEQGKLVYNDTKELVFPGKKQEPTPEYATTFSK